MVSERGTVNASMTLRSPPPIVHSRFENPPTTSSPFTAYFYYQPFRNTRTKSDKNGRTKQQNPGGLHKRPVPPSGSCDVVDTSPIPPFHREDIRYEGGVSAIARPRDFRGRPPRASITRAHPSSAPLHMSTRLHESSVTVKSIATRVGIASFCFSRFLPSRL